MARAVVLVKGLGIQLAGRKDITDPVTVNSNALVLATALAAVGSTPYNR